MPTKTEEIFKSNLPHRAVCVWQYLKYRANKEDFCFPSIRTMCNDLRMSRSTIYRALNDLAKEGFVYKEPRYREYGGQTSSAYFLK